MNITKASPSSSKRLSRCVDAIKRHMREVCLNRSSINPFGAKLIPPIRELLQIVQLEYLVALIRYQAIQYYRASCTASAVACNSRV